ncbi:hypothetical protein L6468_08800 [Prevotella communis]|uniref:hypothetical protein n=1 Tax=Prevotella communis TaxID=2913614 RepID=UPI001EDBE99C|nr:hypothetical protein [Prevotella communis]UKK61103.1 hypothetical protein L6468_08800 [Prevotella communis]UKK63927.1 hypothetical protein L6473_08805 [Prevotella communis]
MTTMRAQGHIPIRRQRKDGVSGDGYERMYKSLSTSTYTGSDPNTSLYGWSSTPTAIDSSKRYRYMTERRFQNGVWGSWSPPVIDSYLSEDGRSISIKGEAKGVIAWGGSLPSSPSEGDTYLHNNNSADDIDVYESGTWEGYTKAIGDGYLVDGYLWMKVADEATASQVRWQNMGKIQGPKGDDGKDSININIDTVAGSLTCNSSGNTTSEQYVEANIKLEKGGTAQTIKSSGGIVCYIDSLSYQLGPDYASESSPTPAQMWKVTITGLGTTSAKVKIYCKNGTNLSSPQKIFIDVKSTIDGTDVTRTTSITISGNTKGNDADPQYEIRSTSDSITVAADNTAATLNATVDFYKKEVGSNPVAFECHWALYRRLGNSYTRISFSGSKVATKQFADISTTVNGTLYDAFVVFINSNSLGSSSFASAAPTTYLAKKEILIKKNGNTGGTGPGGEVYSIMSTMGSITVDSNTNTATFSGSLTFWKKVGSAAKTAYSCHCSLFRKKGSSYIYLTRLSSKATGWSSLSRSINAGTYDALVICIYDSATTAHSDYLAELEIPVYKHGDTGPTYYPCGIYDNEQTYTKSGTRTPLVFVDDPNMATWNEYAQAYGEYWYLVKDTNVVNNVHYAPSDENDYWARAENYGVVMVGAQFARFAKNGAGVMAGDYYYSANGRINGVERVDGEGADGNAVSASNPPAYTRFMGDPTIQNGYFNRTNIQGPISNDKAQLATIYVLRGVTLNVRITGTTYYDGTNNKYGYFNIYKGSTAMCSSVWIYRLRRTVTLTFTAAQSGEYTIVYYGQDASTKASFMANWELTGHFYPNWWVNLKEGKMHGAKDKFILDGDGDIKVDGALMSHNVKLVTTPSHYVTYPEHAAYESNYWSTEGMVKMYEAKSNGYPVRIYEGESPAVYYGLRNCRLLFDQVYIGCALGGTKKVWVFLPPPHLFVGQRIEITNMASNIPSDHSWSGVFVTLDYMDYSRTDYSEGICLTGQEAYFEDDGEGEHDDDGENGMPYICNVPERGGAGPIHAAGIWTGETIQSSGASVFTSNLENELDISDYEWIELTAVEGPFWKYKDTQYWEDTIKYNAYWMLTKWKKREE